MVGVYDAQTLFSGFIDPNSAVFAVYNTDKSNFLADGVDPLTGLVKDNGAPVYTNSSVEAGTTVTAGTSITSGTTITAGTYLYGTSGVGYPAGTGGSVTQGSGSGKSTGVSTLNTITGTIVTNNASLAANSNVSFTFTNTFIGENDMIIAYAVNNANYLIVPGSCTNVNTCAINIRNLTSGPLSDAISIRFAIIKSAT